MPGKKASDFLRTPGDRQWDQTAYGYFGEGIEKADLVGAIEKIGSAVGAAFINDAGSKAEIKHSMHHIGF